MPAGNDGNLKHQNDDIDKIYWEGQEVDKVYIDDKEVWRKETPPVWNAENIDTHVWVNGSSSINLLNYVSGGQPMTFSFVGQTNPFTVGESGSRTTIRLTSGGALSATGLRSNSRTATNVTVRATNSAGSSDKTIRIWYGIPPSE